MRALFPLLIAGAVVSAQASAQEIDWQKLDETLARKPAVSGDVHRYGFPRTDLSVTLDGVTIRPGLALGGWVAFKPVHGGAMVMDDLVLLESEINPVMATVPSLFHTLPKFRLIWLVPKCAEARNINASAAARSPRRCDSWAYRSRYKDRREDLRLGCPHWIGI